MEELHTGGEIYVERLDGVEEVSADVTNIVVQAPEAVMTPLQLAQDKYRQANIHLRNATSEHARQWALGNLETRRKEVDTARKAEETARKAERMTSSPAGTSIFKRLLARIIN